MDRIASIYQERLEEFQKQKKKAQKTSDRLSTLRLLSFIAAAVLLSYGVLEAEYFFAYLSLPLFILFAAFVRKHRRANADAELFSNLADINRTGLQRLSGEWTSFPETGTSYIDHEHPYSTDLNIFGRGSLFQHINTTTSFTGERTLVGLLRGQTRHEEIRPRQRAASDLARRLDFRQHFQAVGAGSLLKTYDPSELYTWFTGELSPAINATLRFLWVLPLLSLALLILGILQLLPYSFFALSLGAQIVIAALGNKHVRPVFLRTEKAVGPLKRCVVLLKQIEGEEFDAPFLTGLQQKLFSDAAPPRPASDQIKILSGIADRIYFRHTNPLIYHPVNMAVLWDWHTLKKLETWKKESGMDIKTWFGVIGEFEALSSLAVLAHDNPDWAYPRVENGPAFLEAASLAHPLIHRGERVANDILLSRPGTILVITGSNMSGKTTMLRTMGINLVLAYAGAPACAGELSCAYMGIYSKMQILDNLEEKVSTFYAELKRNKMIIDAARTRKPLIFLLDEIFRGTNSRDRIFATRNVLKQLLKLPTIGLITTHDLELSVLEKEHPGQVFNYHFTDQIREGQISFDYKLRRGVSKTANALALMEMVGIEVEVEEEETGGDSFFT